MRFTNIRANDLGKVVRKLSLEETGPKRAKHPVYWYRIDGKKVLRVTSPNQHGGSQALSTGFINQIKNSLRLTSEQFIDIVECPLTADEFEQIIREKLNIENTSDSD